MIKVQHGATMLEGDAGQLFIDLVCILHSYIQMMEEHGSREQAEKLLALAGKFAVLDEETLDAKYEEIVEEIGL